MFKIFAYLFELLFLLLSMISVICEEEANVVIFSDTLVCGGLEHKIVFIQSKGKDSGPYSVL